MYVSLPKMVVWLLQYAPNFKGSLEACREYMKMVCEWKQPASDATMIWVP